MPTKFALAVILLAGISSVTWADTKQELIQAAMRVANPDFGENLPGVIQSWDTEKKEAVLTLDLCDGFGVHGFDSDFFEFLVSNNIKATLFVSGRWARANREILAKIAAYPQFAIENHGFDHRPAASRYRQVYGIKSTASLDELYDEVTRNATLLESITGKKPKFYRSGTAFYDNRALALIEALGHHAVGFNVLSGDAAFPNNQSAIVRRLNNIKPGSIILMHLNHPKWQSGAAFKQAFVQYQKAGYRFVHLADVVPHAATP